MKLIFKTEPELSFLIAASVIGQGQATIDDKLVSVLTPPIDRINERLELSELSSDAFWKLLPVQADDVEKSRLEQCLLASGCSELAVDGLTPFVLGSLTDAKLAFRNRYPKLNEQLPLRAGPMREQWEAVGPGLLREIARKTLAQFVPPRTTVFLVQPVRGGDGGLLVRRDAIWAEAVLAHPDPAIPEMLRLAWLVARKGLDRIDGNRWVSPERFPLIASHALVPIVLAAGQELGLCEAGERQILRAIDLWHLTESKAVILRWWGQMHESEIPLPVALKALDKMFTES